MKAWNAVILLLLGGGSIAGAMAAPDIDHTYTVVCIPDDHTDSVLSYYLNSAEHPFCMNGGTCKSNFEQDPDFPCDCPPGLAGPHCEFEDGIVPECELDCYNGGRCQAGVKYPDKTIFKSNKDLQYCICPEGFYGLQCEVEGKRCGSSHCFNGGSCVQIEQKDGTITDHCDCNDAGDDEVSYAGRYCQSPSTVFCAKFADHNGKHFCVNGGECRAGLHLGCDCPEGFTGPVCEFRVQDQEEHKSCDMPCDNNGICRKGVKDFSVLDKFNVNRLDGTFDRSHNQNFEHCVCPIGFVGLACEFRLDVCPGGTHACMHGAECKPSINKETYTLEYRCDCDRADEYGLRYAGKYCQFESTEFCTSDGGAPPRGSQAFCVNGGVCKGFVPSGQDHPGCECKNDFHGPHCEYSPEMQIDQIKDIQGGSKNARGGMAISLTVGFSLLILLVVFLVVYRRQKKREQAFRPKGDTYYRDDIDDFLSSDGDLYGAATESNADTAKAPTFEDLDLMINTISEETSRDLVLFSDEDKSFAASAPSYDMNSNMCSEPYTLAMSSLGTNGSNSSFVEDPTTGRAMLMKQSDELD